MSNVSRQQMKKLAAAAVKAATPKHTKRKQQNGDVPKQGHFEGIEPPDTPKRPDQKETRLHINCVKRMRVFYPEEWLDCYHYPSEEPDEKTRIKNAAKDVKGGFWDYLVLIERHGFQGLFIEFKVTKPLSKSQKAFRRKHRHRFAFAVVKTEERFLAVISWYLGPSRISVNNWKTNPII